MYTPDEHVRHKGRSRSHCGRREGGRRRVVVPPELGPPTGPATFFSAKQWEVFDIELLKVKSCERQQTGFMTSTVVCTD